MRLFANSAYFITLITNTIADIRVFMVVVLLIIIAFANFFFILNIHTPDGSQGFQTKWKNLKISENGWAENDPRIGKQSYSYIDDNMGDNVLNALLAMYLLSLGEFSFDGFSKGENSNLAWVFFVIATFLCLVVFMNMLIAIMGETFA